MKYILMLVALLICNAELLSQENLDVITLKDGTIYKGTLAEYAPQGKTTMILIDGRSVEVNSSDINDLHESKNRAFAAERKGFVHSSTLGFLLGQRTYDNDLSFQYNMVNGYRINKWEMGLGTGVEILSYNLTTPIFLNINYEFKSGRTTPFISGQLGRSINLGFDEEESNSSNNSIYKSGFITGLSLGIRHRFTSELGLQISAGYRYYDLKGSYTQRDWIGDTWVDYPVDTRIYLHRFNFALGLVFN